MQTCQLAQIEGDGALQPRGRAYRYALSGHSAFPPPPHCVVPPFRRPQPQTNSKPNKLRFTTVAASATATASPTIVPLIFSIWLFVLAKNQTKKPTQTQGRWKRQRENRILRQKKEGVEGK